MSAKNLTRVVVVAFALLATAALFAHPEDDFCEPGDDSMDPALCAALAELNSAEGKIQQSGLPSVLDESGNERSITSTAAPGSTDNSSYCRVRL